MTPAKTGGNSGEGGGSSVGASIGGRTIVVNMMVEGTFVNTYGPILARY